MYDFIRNMWIMKRCSVEFVSTQMLKGRITQEQSVTIVETPQIVEEQGGV